MAPLIPGGLVLALVAWVGTPHDRGLSSAAVRVESDAVVVVATFHRAELAAPADPNAVRELFRAGYRVVVAGSALDLLDCSARPVPPTDTEVTLRFAAGREAVAGRTFTIEVPLLAKLDLGHRHHVAAFVATSPGAGTPLALLDRDHSSAVVSLDAAAAPRFPGFLMLGIEHVLTGYDHVLFLLALLLVGMPLARTLGVITAFTAAHSITLALAALELVTPPSTIVEPMIAATIVYVGLENLFVREPRRRWLVAGTLGLVHGFGFAAVLRELGIGSGTEAVVPLLGFNLGVELGQAAIAVVALPLLALGCRTPAARRGVVVVGSVLTCALGGWWLLERTVLA